MLFPAVMAAWFQIPRAAVRRGESMLHIVLASARPQAMQAFAAALSSNPEVNLQRVSSGAEALAAARPAAPHLVIIDADLPDTPPLDLVRQLLMVNALVNTAVVSPLSDEEFHEASEGLGILGRLPHDPSVSDAGELVRKLRTVLGAG
jgi:DNA-binding NarL/FixJ family response regulator